ncbi:DotI/IcmL/TraM family protein [Paraglaciecola sp. Hal342]
MNRNKSLIRLSKVLLGLIVISIGASATLGYSVLSLSQRDMVELAYGIDEENRIIELSETSIPTVNEGDVKLRAGELVSKLHKYSTTDWQLQTDSFERDFVDSDAHREFVKALDRSQIIRTINTGVQLTWAEITEAPRIVDIADDGSSWEIELPFTWYIGADNLHPQAQAI